MVHACGVGRVGLQRVQRRLSVLGRPVWRRDDRPVGAVLRGRGLPGRRFVGPGPGVCGGSHHATVAAVGSEPEALGYCICGGVVDGPHRPRAVQWGCGLVHRAVDAAVALPGRGGRGRAELEVGG